MSRQHAPLVISDGVHQLTITDHPTQADSTLIRVDGPGGRADLVLGERVEEHVHDWLRNRPVCQIGNCTTERPTGRDCVELHVCDFDDDGRCLHCNLEARHA
jgi:hypothetical protein